MAESALDSTLSSPIWLSSIKSLELAIRQVWGSDNLPVVFTTGLRGARALAKMKDRITLPYIGYSIVNVGQNRSGVNLQAAKRIGIRGGLHRSGDYWWMFHLVPVTVTFTLRFITNNGDDILKWIDCWFKNQEQFTFNMVADEAKFDIFIQVRPNLDSISPPEEAEDDEGLMFEMECNVDMDTYIGNIQKTPAIGQIALNVNTLGYTKYQELLAAGSLEPPAEVFKFDASLRRAEV